jgi:hypothetical protein
MTNELHDTGTVEVWADTVRLRVLAESDLEQRASTEASAGNETRAGDEARADDEARASIEAPVQGFDPYNTDISALDAGARPRRSLDDMRALSEAIVANRLKTKGNA